MGGRSSEPQSAVGGRPTAAAEHAVPVVQRLRTIVAWTGVGNASYLLAQYAMLIALAKLGGPTEVGHFALAQAIVAPLIVVSQMQLRQLQVTDVSGEVVHRDYLRVRVWATVAAVVAAVAVAVAFYGGGSLVAVVGLTALGRGVESVSDVHHGLLQRHDRMDRIAVSLVARGALSFVGFTAALALTGSLPLALAVVAAVAALVLAVVDARFVRVVREPARRVRGAAGAGRRLLLLAWPLTVSAGLLSLSANVPRYFLEWLEGPEAVALYAVAMMPISLVGLFTGAISQASLARAATHFQRGERAAYRRLTLQVAAVAAVAGAGVFGVCLVVGRPLVERLFSAEFVGAAPVMTVLAAGISVGAVGAFGATTLVAARRFRLQLLNVVLALAAQIPLCFWLIRLTGVEGAAWAEFGRYAVAALYLAVAGWVVYRQHDWAPAGRGGGLLPGTGNH